MATVNYSGKNNTNLWYIATAIHSNQGS